jgi:hypothetical protein
MFSQKSLGVDKKLKRISDLLPIVNKLGLVSSLKPREPETTLRKMTIQLVVLTEEHDRSVENLPVLDETKTAKRIRDGVDRRVIQSSSSYGFFHCEHNLSLVKGIQREIQRRLILPSSMRMDMLQKPSLKLWSCPASVDT